MSEAHTILILKALAYLLPVGAGLRIDIEKALREANAIAQKRIEVLEEADDRI